MIASLYVGSMFYSKGQAEDDKVENHNVYVDLGEDHPEEIEKKLKERI